jgi:outer membrane biosynthesis protein TonB
VGFPRRQVLHRYLRVATATALVAFGTIVVAGALALFSPAGDLVRTAGLSDEAATPCTQQAWLNRDPSCLSGRDMPWIAASRNSEAIAPAAGIAERIPTEPVLSESRHTVPQQAVPRSEVAALGRELVVQPPVVEDRQPPKPAAAAPTPSVRKVAVEAPSPATKKTIEAQPPAVKRTAIETQLPREKKTARRDQTVKRHTTEAANTVRRFDDNLNGIPVSSFAADGTRRTIMIRPTSIQDVYYYSSRR